MTVSKRLAIWRKDWTGYPRIILPRLAVHQHAAVRAVRIDQQHLIVCHIGNTSISKGDIVIRHVDRLECNLCYGFAIALHTKDLPPQPRKKKKGGGGIQLERVDVASALSA